MYQVELTNINREETRYTDFYHYDLMDGETTYCRIFISEGLNNIIRSYIPSGIQLFDQSTAKAIKYALNELYDRMSAACHEEFDARKSKTASLANAVYAIKQMKLWCESYERGMFKVRKSNVETPVS